MLTTDQLHNVQTRKLWRDYINEEFAQVEIFFSIFFFNNSVYSFNFHSILKEKTRTIS